MPERPLQATPCKPLQPGDSVAVVAPAGAVAPARLEGAVRLLEGRGLRVLTRADIASRHRSMAGPDARRADELRWALEEPGVGAVFLARGGYGGQRILDRALPRERSEPRAVVGFSDNTALLNHLRQRLGWVTLHGPHPQEDHPEELDEILDCLGFRGRARRPCYEGLRVLANGGGNGAVEGEVAGGCLSLVASSVGTSYAVDCRGKILFLEDVGEPVYRLDRMLQQLRASGSLDGVSAAVFGRPETFLADPAELGAAEELLMEFAGSVRFPVLAGLPCGHTRPNRPLPFGPRARLEPELGTLTYLESAVQA